MDSCGGRLQQRPVPLVPPPRRSRRARLPPRRSPGERFPGGDQSLRPQEPLRLRLRGWVQPGLAREHAAHVAHIRSVGGALRPWLSPNGSRGPDRGAPIRSKQSPGRRPAGPSRAKDPRRCTMRAARVFALMLLMVGCLTGKSFAQYSNATGTFDANIAVVPGELPDGGASLPPELQSVGPDLFVGQVTVAKSGGIYSVNYKGSREDGAKLVINATFSSDWVGLKFGSVEVAGHG